MTRRVSRENSQAAEDKDPRAVRPDRVVQATTDEMLQVSPINAFAEKFTAGLDAYVREQLPTTMENREYEMATAAMLLSLSRVTATCAVAFAETHGVKRDFVQAMLGRQLGDNLTIAYDALRQGQGSSH